MADELNISTHPSGPIISFHPLVKADYNFWAFSAINDELLSYLYRANIVIWPQVFPSQLYFYACQKGLRSFPNYDIRFKFPGKSGQMLLFKALDLPYPNTIFFPKIAALGSHPNAIKVKIFSYPFVLKTDDEHEGQGVFLIENESAWQRALARIKQREREGKFGFLMQEFLPVPYDLRVVVIGREFFPFWRALGPNFKANLAQGGKAIPCPDKTLEKKAFELTKTLCFKTGINLAAIDFLIHPEDSLLLNEINFVFGRRLLGKSFNKLFFKAVKDFIDS
ncbi:ATP-grasp domain-containing protein [Thermodesulfatator indicus]